MKDRKVICEECEWVGMSSEVLIAKHPFEHGEQVQGCPICKCVESLLVACDEPGCMKRSKCGFPTPSGYRHTCYDHMEEKK